MELQTNPNRIVCQIVLASTQLNLSNLQHHTAQLTCQKPLPCGAGASRARSAAWRDTTLLQAARQRAIEPRMRWHDLDGSRTFSCPGSEAWRMSLWCPTTPGTTTDGKEKLDASVGELLFHIGAGVHQRFAHHTFLQRRARKDLVYLL